MKRIYAAAAIVALCFSTPLAAMTRSVEAAKAKVEEARALLASGKSGQAITLFRQAVELDAQNATAHNALGSLLNSLGHYAEALPHAEEAARLDPSNARYRYNRGVVRAEHGRFKEAVADFDVALTAHPDLTYGWLERGAAKLSLGDPVGAQEDWRRAAQSDPKLIWSHWYVATADFVEGRFAEAAAGFDRVAEAEAGFVPAKLWRTIAHARAGTPIVVPQGGSSDWPAQVLSFLRGDRSREALLQFAAQDRLTGDQRRLGEAHFFLAQDALAMGARGDAIESLRRALVVKAPRHVWRISAERELQRLEGKR